MGKTKLVTLKLEVLKSVQVSSAILCLLCLTLTGCLTDSGLQVDPLVKSRSELSLVKKFENVPSVIPKLIESNCTMNLPDYWETEIVALARYIFPQDCGIVYTTPPAFMWPSISVIPWNISYANWDPQYEEHIVTVTYPDGRTKSYTSNRNYLTWPEVLPAGGPYRWQVVSKSLDTKLMPVTRTSANRTFFISSQASELLVPNIELTIRDVALLKHPRVFANDAYLGPITESFKPGGSRNADFNSFKSLVDSVDLPFVIPTDDGANVGKQIHRLMMMYLFTKEAVYFEKMKAIALTMATWDAKAGPSSYVVNDLLAASTNLLLARVFDAGYDKFSIEERNLILNSIKTRQIDLVDFLDGSGGSKLRFRPDSHSFEDLGSIVITSLILLGETPEAEGWLREMLPLYVNSFTPWGGEDGGYNQGLGYFRWDVYYGSSLQMRFLKNMTGIDLFKKSSFKNFGYLAMYFSPPSQPWMVFGDGPNSNMSSGETADRDQMRGIIKTGGRFPDFNWMGFAYLSYYFENKHYKWLLDNTALEIKDNDQVDHILRPLKSAWPGTAPDGNFPTSALFSSVGWVAMHSSIVDANRTSVYFKSSPYGNWSHAHADQNSFVVFSKGLPLAIESGFYGKWGENWSTRHHYLWNKQTVSKNAITYDNGNGQYVFCGSPRGNKAAKGQITQFDFNGKITMSTGEAREAYRDLSVCPIPDNAKPIFKNATRSMLYFKEKDVFLVFDDINSESGTHSFEWNIHSPEKMTYRPDGVLELNNGGVKMCVQLSASNPLQFVQTNKFDPNQIRASFYADDVADPDSVDPALGTVTEFAQWHSRFYTKAISGVSIAAVLKIGCESNRTNVQITQLDAHSWRAIIDGESYLFNGKSLIKE